MNRFSLCKIPKRVTWGVRGVIFSCWMPIIAFAQDGNLATQSGYALGGSLSSYRYSEPGYMNISSNKKTGLEISGTYALDSEWPNQYKGWFLKTELSYLTGKVDYDSTSTGSLSNRTDWYYEARILAGKDYTFQGSVFSPYIGFGYRYLFNDLRGTSTTNTPGYRRQSTYYSIPIGVTHKFNLANQRQLHTTVEYDYLLRGLQRSNLSDANTGKSDVSHTQRSGYGLRLSTMVRMDKWTVGPSLIYWNIKNSDIANSSFEPQNSTTEIGLKANYLF